MTSNMQDPRVYSAIQLSAETARRYGAGIVAEGIESELQKQQILQLGITIGQGFLFAKAIAYEVFIDFAMQSSTAEDQRTNGPFGMSAQMISSAVN